MSQAPEHPRDPLAWHALIALAFLGLVLVRLTIPSKPFFDEVHYLPAAFAWFWPILSAASLPGEMAFERWMWLDGWR